MKKYVLKGLFLSLSLIFLNKAFLVYLKPYLINVPEGIGVGVAFGVIVFMFLMTDKIKHLLVTGFVGLGCLIGAEIILSLGLSKILFEPFVYYYDTLASMFIYFIGFIGSLFGITAAIILTAIKVNIFNKYTEVSMEKPIKIKLIAYAFISAVSFSYLILPENAGVSVPIFTIIQFACLWFIFPKKKPLFLFIPIFILSLNSFLYTNQMWNFSNFIITILLYSVMILALNDNFSLIKIDFKLTSQILKTVFVPFKFSTVPFEWRNDLNKDNNKLMARILLGVLISLPILIFLIIMLSAADSVFSQGVFNAFKDLFNLIKPNAIAKIFIGIIAGIYLFGIAYMSRLIQAPSPAKPEKNPNGDFVILNIVLFSILAVYAVFVAIQFRYLFSGATLPYNLTYSEYARKGFFELLFLTAANILMIIINIALTRNKQGAMSKINKWLCHILCAVTIILLASSFRRMWLYNSDDGLTRLRLLVFGFLIFECLGLLITFFYIAKPRFNIISTYTIIALAYYLLLNLAPLDAIIARDQIDRSIFGQSKGIDYVLTLSADASGEIERLLASKETSEKAQNFLDYHNQYFNSIPKRWQRFHLY